MQNALKSVLSFASFSPGRWFAAALLKALMAHLVLNYEFKLDKILQGHQRWVWDCAFSADSAYLVTGRIPRSVNPKNDPSLISHFSASSDHTARLWEMASGETVRQYNGHHKGESSPSLRCSMRTRSLTLASPFQRRYAARCTMVLVDS